MAITRKLLVVATLAWVAPLSAHQAPAALNHHESPCPSKRSGAAAAQAKQAAPVAAWAPAKSATPAVVVVEGTPGAASVLGLGRSPVFML
jgi:hypothetical protein